MNDDNLVEIQNLEVVFESKDSTITAVDNINLNIPKNSIVGIVGESGSGKSTTALSILNLIPDPGVVKNGSVYFNSQNILTMYDIDLRKIRCKEIIMIFQDSRSSLNPSITIGTQISEILETHSGLSRKEAENEVNRQIIYYPNSSILYNILGAILASNNNLHEVNESTCG